MTASSDTTPVANNYVADAVAAFNKAMDNKPDADLRATLVQEEAKEVIEAAAHLLKELADFAYVVEGFAQLPDGTPHLEANVSFLNNDPIVRLALKLSIKFANAVGPDVLKQAFLRVHLSNMSKLGADGKPVRNSQGKVLKGPNYKPPVLSDVVDEI